MASFGHFDHFLGPKMAQNRRFEAIPSMSHTIGVWVCGSSAKSAFQRSNRKLNRSYESRRSSQNVACGGSTSEPYFEYFFQFVEFELGTWWTGATSSFRNCPYMLRKVIGSAVLQIFVKSTIFHGKLILMPFRWHLEEFFQCITFLKQN